MGCLGMKCDCYKTKPLKQLRYDPITGKPSSEIKTVGYCSGTRENDLCDCCGDTVKCDFYPEKRKAKQKPITNFERIKAMGVEEMANFICSIMTLESCERLCPAREICTHGNPGMKEWLEMEVQQ